MSTIVFDKVSKHYGGTPAIESFNLKVRNGELLVLVGPSGCGKSTLLRMVAGLEEISAGEIRINGRVINDLPPQKRDLAMVFQNYALYPHMTVRQNLAFPLKMRRFSRVDVKWRVEETAALLDLIPLLERRPKQLSGGQRQRVAMGRALVRRADLFLMDEPLSNLDAKLRSQIRSEIAALQARLGITTLYVTHDQVEAMTLGHRVAVMREGRLQQVAEPRALYQHPANIFVGSFIGNPGMNLLRASLSRKEDNLALNLGETTLPLSPENIASHPGIEAWCERELLVGIRPEAISLSGENGPGTVHAVARSIEALGHETLVHAGSALSIMAGDTDSAREGATIPPPLSIALPGHRVIRAGDKLQLCITGDGLCLFTPDGVAIS